MENCCVFIFYLRISLIIKNMSDQKFSQAFMILVLSGILLMIYPWLYSRVDFLQQNFKTYTVFDWSEQDTVEVVDSLGVFAVSADTIVEDTMPPAYDGMVYLKDFFRKLRKGKGQIRIAYYGDSAIEGDMICQTLRDSLQKKFGGAGVGFVPIYSAIAGFRNTINHHASDNWGVWNFGFKHDSPFSFGYGGEVFSTKRVVDSLVVVQDSVAVMDSLKVDTIIAAPIVEEEVDEGYTVRYVASKRYAGVSTLANPYLFYGAPRDRKTFGRVDVTQFRKSKEYDLTGKKEVNRLPLQAGGRKVELDFVGIDSMPIYGMSFESKNGVIVDNLPSRGNSAAWLMRLNTGVMQQFNDYFDVDLVVLQYGLNVMNAKMTDYSWYKKEIKRVIAKMKKSYPSANILLVGPSDKGTKIVGEMVTDPSIPRITAVMRQAAEESKVAFFSFYETMGGSGTMVDWVENKKPRWANLDYTHFNFRGAREAGYILIDFLLNGFNEFND